ncbi:MAG TPA: hypothetical protein VGM62_17485 [Chthoniobacterales bacterium]|jgi:hypothetical protein
MTLKSSILTFTATTALFVATTFAADPKKELIGKWTEADGVETVEYKADGTMTETLAGGDVMKGKYSFSDASHIKVEFEGPMGAMGPIVSPFTMKGDQLDVTGVDGQSVAHYNRVKADAAK